MGACCIATRGMICIKQVYAVVCEHPEVVTSEEVRPEIREVEDTTQSSHDHLCPKIIKAEEE